MSINEILDERLKTHGAFNSQAITSQDMKIVMRNSRNWSSLESTHREALDMIAHKIARILNGDHTHVDHWDDIAGYATLVSRYHTSFLGNQKDR